MTARKHDTLTPNAVYEVTLDPCSAVEVLSRDGVGEVYFTIDGTTPTVQGDDTYCVPAAIGALRADTGKNPGSSRRGIQVRLISTEAVAFSVSALV